MIDVMLTDGILFISINLQKLEGVHVSNYSIH